jgi:hypothetical protein
MLMIELAFELLIANEPGDGSHAVFSGLRLTSVSAP